MAEDNPGDVTLMRAAFYESGLAAELEVATDGEAAVTLLLNPSHITPDLIILNFNLPKLQGHQVLSAIKRTESLLGVPVVMLTTSDSQRDRLLSKTADAYFIKSGDWDQLLLIVRHLRDLILASPSLRPTTRKKLREDTFWQQGVLGPQGSGERPIGSINLTDATERKFIGEPLDEPDDKK